MSLSQDALIPDAQPAAPQPSRWGPWGYPAGAPGRDLRIDYMRAARPRAGVVAHADCFRRTRQIAFVRAIAHDGDPDDPIAAAQAAFMLETAR